MAKAKTYDFSKMSEEQKTSKLKELVPSYYQTNRSYNDLKKENDEESAELKALMLDMNLEEAEFDGYKATLSVSEKQTLDENALIKYLLDNNLTHLTKQIVVLDEEALENAVYNGEVNPIDLAQFQSTSTTTRLGIKGV